MMTPSVVGTPVMASPLVIPHCCAADWLAKAAMAPAALKAVVTAILSALP